MPHRYLLFYKPFDVLCQFTNPDRLACLTLKNFIDVPGVYSAGRLDRDSEGLLLLTDHGAMKHRLTHPQFQHPRTYWVQVERCPNGTALEQLRRGVTIKGGYRTRPAEVSLLEAEPALPPRNPPIRYRKTVPTAWLSLTLTEGRNRQVRRMTAAVGHPTLRLVRMGIGAAKPPACSEAALSPSGRADGSEPPASPTGLITLQGLQPGQWRDLDQQEVQQLPSLWGTQVPERPSSISGNHQHQSAPAPASKPGSRPQTSRSRPSYRRRSKPNASNP